MRAFTTKFTVIIADDFARIDFFDTINNVDTESGSIVMTTEGAKQ